MDSHTAVQLLGLQVHEVGGEFIDKTEIKRSINGLCFLFCPQPW